ncbi:hypothetical protein EZV62_015557 [Acer yangbiense]|uniref:Uncharacterized protein n=1 Tax=Acer yangbiense TaxID=1000413 RepID=A0A5C7HLI2_9ROSI|nr:hypothetical protein EZV62_015557 [Acer yangbiense]
MNIDKEEEEEERENLIIRNAKVVEYLQPIMSRELLCKFPDNSSFDFDYSQSSIWSPLVPRTHSPMDLDLITPRKLSYEFGLFGFELEKKSMKKKKKKNTITTTTTSLNINLNLFKKKNTKKVSDFSPASSVKGSCAPITTKGWSKLLKAASRHFKKKKKKKRDSAAHVNCEALQLFEKCK